MTNGVVPPGFPNIEHNLCNNIKSTTSQCEMIMLECACRAHVILRSGNFTVLLKGSGGALNLVHADGLRSFVRISKLSLRSIE